MKCRMDEAKSTLIQSAIDLFANHGMKQKAIFDMIRESIVDYVSNLPTRLVLYNNCFGGHGYSPEFKRYLKDITGEKSITSKILSKESRENHVHHITPFGRSSLDRMSQYCECIIDVLYIFRKYDFNSIAKLLNYIHSKETELQNVIRNGKMLKEYLNSSPNEPVIDNKIYSTPSEWCLIFSKCNFTRYKIGELQELLAKHENGEYVNKLSIMIDEAKTKIIERISEPLLIELNEFVLEKEKQNKAERKANPWHASEEGLSFLESVEKYGFENDFYWNNQTYYDTNALRFILDKYKYIKKNENEQLVYDIVVEDYVMIQDDMLSEVEEYFGLLCASGPYSKLDIAEIPALVDYRIGEYDGNENVYIV